MSTTNTQEKMSTTNTARLVLQKVYMQAGLNYQQAKAAALTSLGEEGYAVSSGYAVPRRSIHSY